MSNRTLAQFYRARWPQQRLSEDQLAVLGASPKIRSRLARRLGRAAAIGDPLDNLEIALLTQNSAWDVPLNPAIELAGRGYRRAPVGPLVVSGPGAWRWTNKLLILFPQAKDDWGLVYYLALLQIGVDSVVATTPIAAPPFPVVAEDQPRIAARDLVIGGVHPNTRRPYGAGRYGESLYGGWPAEGDVFFLRLDDIGYQWATQPNACAPWTELQLVSGGCSA